MIRWKLTKLYEFIFTGNIIMIHKKKKNNNNQGVFLELLVAANKCNPLLLRHGENCN